jgi:hypothetical protein
MDSILTSIKKMLGLEEDQTCFDQDIIININSVIMVLSQLGIGPTEGFVITGSTEKWTDLLGERKDLESVKTYIYMKVRLLFDPPTSSFVIESINKMITEFEWRLNIQVEGGLIDE